MTEDLRRQRALASWPLVAVVAADSRLCLQLVKFYALEGVNFLSLRSHLKLTLNGGSYLPGHRLPDLADAVMSLTPSFCVENLRIVGRGGF